MLRRDLDKERGEPSSRLQQQVFGGMKWCERLLTFVTPLSNLYCFFQVTLFSILKVYWQTEAIPVPRKTA